MMDNIDEYGGNITTYEITGFRVRNNNSQGEHEGTELIEEVSDNKAEFFSLDFIDTDNSNNTLFVDNFKTKEQAVNFANKLIKFSTLWIGNKNSK